MSTAVLTIWKLKTRGRGFSVFQKKKKFVLVQRFKKKKKKQFVAREIEVSCPIIIGQA